MMLLGLINHNVMGELHLLLDNQDLKVQAELIPVMILISRFCNRKSSRRRLKGAQFNISIQVTSI